MLIRLATAEATIDELAMEAVDTVVGRHCARLRYSGLYRSIRLRYQC